MDLGLGSFIEKFEVYFGKKITRGLLAIVGLATAAVSVSFIWTWLVAPLLKFFSTPLWGTTLAGLVLTTVAIGGGISLSSHLSSGILSWQRARRMKAMLVRSERQLQGIRFNADEQMAKLREMNNKSREIRQSALEVGRKAKKAYEMALIRDSSLTDAQRADLLAEIPDFADEGSDER